MTKYIYIVSCCVLLLLSTVNKWTYFFRSCQGIVNSTLINVGWKDKTIKDLGMRLEKKHLG